MLHDKPILIVGSINMDLIARVPHVPAPGETILGHDFVMLPDGPIKTFTLRGIKDTPPYLHDGRLMTLADTVEFFNLVLGLRLSQPEKDSLVAYMLAL